MATGQVPPAGFTPTRTTTSIAATVRRVFPSTAARLAFQTAPSLPRFRLSLLRACPVRRSLCVCPSCIWTIPFVPALCGRDGDRGHPPFEEFYSSTPEALAPVWVMLSQSIITYAASCVPLPGTSRFHRSAAYTRCLRCAGAPRRPRSGSVLSLSILSRHVALCDSGKFDGCIYPVPSPSTLAFVKG